MVEANMAFSFTNYAGIEPQASPWQDMIGKVLGGYTDMTKAKYLQPGLEEALKKEKLHNQYYGPNMESQIGLRGAQAGHLGSMTTGQNITNKYLPQTLQAALQAKKFNAENPLLGMTGGAGQVGALLYLQQHPELMAQQQQSGQQNNLQNLGQDQSYIPSLNQQQQGNQQHLPNPQELMMQSIMASLKPKDRKFAPSNIGKLQQEYKEAQEGKYPGTNVPFESEQAKEDVLSSYREKLGGLKTGEHYIYDPETHEKIGQERPLSPKERETETGRSFFNEVFPEINNGFKDFIGKDSVKNFVKYADQYGINPVATKKIDDLLLAQKLIAPGVVNEATTLGAGKTNQTYRSLLKSFPGSDIPSLIERYGKEYKLPTDAFIKAGIRFQNKVNSATERASNSIPATKKVYFHPEKYLKSNTEKSAKSESQSNNKKSNYTDEDIRHTAQKYGISEKEVREKIKKAA